MNESTPKMHTERAAAISSRGLRVLVVIETSLQ
jgi:hypothetical protein